MSETINWNFVTQVSQDSSISRTKKARQPGQDRAGRRKKEKDQAIKGWDRRLQKRKAPIERLEKDLREMKKKTGDLEKVNN